MGDIFLSDAEDTCPTCHSTVYELYNDRKCGALFLKGYVLKSEMDSYGRAYLWRYSGQVIDTSTLKEIHLYIPEKGFIPQNRGKYPLRPCYLDSRSGFINFRDDSLAGKLGKEKITRTRTVVEYATAFFLLVIVSKLLEGQFVFASGRVTVTSPKTPPTYRSNLYYLPKKKKCCY